jgi:hypothetical protein
MGDSIEFLGNTNPQHLLNLTPTLSLLDGRLRLSSLFVYRGNWVQTNFTELNKCSMGPCRGRNDPDSPLFLQAQYVGFRKPGLSYAPYQEDGTFTRWAEASLSYNLHEDYVSWLGVSSATLTVSARNLKIWTDYSGLDPEVTQHADLRGNFGTLWDLGYDNPVSPPTRYWIMRLTLGL